MVLTERLNEDAGWVKERGLINPSLLFVLHTFQLFAPGYVSKIRT